MPTDDPWKDLTAPRGVGIITARRVDASLPWNFFWGRGRDGRPLLVFRHAPESAPSGHLPRLRGIEITDRPDHTGLHSTLSFALVDEGQKDIFYRLCRDIIDAASPATTEADAVDRALARTWRWHHLLRGGRDSRLSPEEQMGLLGELLALERLLFPNLPVGDAVAAWRGPLDAPKDFEFGRICIEAKAHRPSARPIVWISSEHQLDDEGIELLALWVVSVGLAPDVAASGVSVSEVALRLRMAIETSEPDAVDTFERTLEAAGFRWEDDYSDTRWIEGAASLYQVVAGFPRITASRIATGVSHVQYGVHLNECGSFRVDESTVIEALRHQS